MATTITLYETKLSPYDNDRPNDPLTYLENCQSSVITVNRDLNPANLTELELEVRSTLRNSMNYLSIECNAGLHTVYYYFITAISFHTLTAASVSLRFDPWSTYYGLCRKIQVEQHSTVLKTPRPFTDDFLVDYSAGVDGKVLNATAYYTEEGTSTTNSFRGRGIPVAFCEVCDGRSATAKTYPVVMYSATIDAPYQNSTLDFQIEYLLSGISKINLSGTYSMDVGTITAPVTIQNVEISRIYSLYIIPFYALAGLYNNSAFYGLFDTVGSLYYDGNPIGRSYMQFIGQNRSEPASNFTRAFELSKKLFVGNDHASIHIQRPSDYNGTCLHWAMAQSGATLTVQEMADTTIFHDLTGAIILPNSSFVYRFTETTTDAEKALNRIASGAAIAGGVAAVAGGIATANPLAVVAGAGTTARAITNVVTAEKGYRGEGANGYTSQGSGTNIDGYHTITTGCYVDAVNHQPVRSSYEIPIITVFEVYSEGSIRRAYDLFYNGYVVGDIPAHLYGYGATTLTDMVNETDGIDFWLFDRFVLCNYDVPQRGDIWAGELAEMFTTTGVRIWDTTTPAKCEEFKQKYL